MGESPEASVPFTTETAVMAAPTDSPPPNGGSDVDRATFNANKVLLVVAIVLFVLAGIGVTLGANISFVAIGLAAFAASFLAD